MGEASSKSGRYREDRQVLSPRHFAIGPGLDAFAVALGQSAAGAGPADRHVTPRRQRAGAYRLQSGYTPRAPVFGDGHLLSDNDGRRPRAT